MVKSTRHPIASQRVATKHRKTEENGCVGPKVSDPSSVHDTHPFWGIALPRAPLSIAADVLLGDIA